LTQFLPVYDKLNELKAQYGEDAFGKQYNALGLQSSFASLGVTEFALALGDTVDASRMVVTESVHSDAAAANCVLEPLSTGLELDGNIVRMAECVASLGPEQPPVEEAAATEGGTPAAPEGGVEGGPIPPDSVEPEPLT